MSDSALRTMALGFLHAFPVEAAAQLEQASDDESCALLADLPVDRAAAVISALAPPSATRLLSQLSPALAARLLAALEPSRAAPLLARLDEDKRQACLAELPTRTASELAALIAYPPQTAGALMDPQVMAFRPQMLVSNALEQLRRLPQKKAREIFLVDERGLLVGAVPLQELVIAEPGGRLEQATSDPPATVLPMASVDEVVEALAEPTKASVVVVDFEGHLLGVIRRDALIQAARAEASADVQSMVGASKEERALSRVTFAVGKRLPWLVVNLGTAFLAAAVVGLFEQTIAAYTALAVLLPVVAGQSGNTGAQALAVTMRGLALREVRVRHAGRVCFKELRVALLNGLAVAAITAAAVFLWSRSLGLMLVIGLSMVLSMMAAGLAGAAIPMVLTALKQDPAQSSSIVLTTVTDVVGFFSFLGIASAFAQML
jgi:magnesium transporter